MSNGTLVLTMVFKFDVEDNADKATIKSESPLFIEGRLSDPVKV